MKNTRVPGHGLVSEGRPRFYSDACDNPQCVDYQRRKAEYEAQGIRWESVWEEAYVGRLGHARCSCGAESGHLPSQGARRRWHAAHKVEVTS